MRKGYVEILVDRCKGCEMCVAACPNDLLTFPMETLNKAGALLKSIDQAERPNRRMEDRYAAAHR